jgi:hypothetical protein
MNLDNYWCCTSELNLSCAPRMLGSSISDCPGLLAVLPWPLSLFRGCVRKANFSFLDWLPQIRRDGCRWLLFGADLAAGPNGPCVRDHRSDRERQQVSKLVIQRLEQRLHCLSRKKGLQ